MIDPTPLAPARVLFAGDLVLEPLTVAHAPEMFVVLSDPAVYRFLDYPPPPSVDHLRGVYAAVEGRRSPDGRQWWLNWIVRAAHAGVIGYVQCTVTPSSRRCSVGFVFESRRWGHGHAGRATQAMLDHVGPSFAIERFVATVEVANARSIRLLARLGFTHASPDEAAHHALSTTERLLSKPGPSGVGEGQSIP